MYEYFAGLIMCCCVYFWLFGCSVVYDSVRWFRLGVDYVVAWARLVCLVFLLMFVLVVCDVVLCLVACLFGFTCWLGCDFRYCFALVY